MQRYELFFVVAAIYTFLQSLFNIIYTYQRFLRYDYNTGVIFFGGGLGAK